MDLALEFGMPAELLARTLSEREFQRWQRYVQRKPLPTRRLEYYLAQIAQWIAMTMGGASNSTLPDFLVKFVPQQVIEDDEEVDVDALREAFDFKPRKR